MGKIAQTISGIDCISSVVHDDRRKLHLVVFMSFPLFVRKNLIFYKRINDKTHQKSTALSLSHLLPRYLFAKITALLGEG